jgi:molecular chaperone HtpG
VALFPDLRRVNAGPDRWQQQCEYTNGKEFMDNYTRIEQEALKATNYKAFPLNLLEIRTNIKDLLSEVQRYGFFNEYTTHSFDHVTAMLEMAEWIIPEDTKKILTPADYLFITLAIYFHDLGLLISEHEYKNRKSNLDYQRYISDQSTSSIDQIEYMDKLGKLPPEEAQRVQYQEFVRKTHGSRVRAWIEGSWLDDDNSSQAIRGAIQSLIGKLESVARQGLAILCESHTIDDITDTSKYKVSMPYGEHVNETVNLQYAAIVLRAVDLLQITRSRAPSILYQVISPKDPVSQIEWQKQNAVRSIRPAPGRDREGKASNTIQSDTIQVFARFEKSDGFFGLTSYLAYARAQLNLCQDALKKSEAELPNPPSFPWRYIDDTGVEAVGFLTQSFGFELDQHKILDLLTGHTLYNDTDVVLRELTQNALDAVRLQSNILKTDISHGRIDISWDSRSKILEVRDNGTGMSQSVIEDHLLKVGSSRYQDPKFREKFPEFSSISRFGIGVLSAFMVADNVEITTCSLDDPEARQISLRSVHGKYLIKLLDKGSEKKEIGVYPHGSRVRLKLRSTADIGNILQVARMWLLFPRCKVYVTVDEQSPVMIGFDTPKQALESYMEQSKFRFGSTHVEYEVREVTDGGVTLAFVVERDELYKDWTFTRLPEHRSYSMHEDEIPTIATCVEGVGVEFTTPGFKSTSMVAITNIVGKGAPKTNVARSALEDTKEYRDTLKKTYRLYAQHVTDEITRLAESANYSLSRAVEQAPFIADPLTSMLSTASRSNILDDELSKIPYILLEEDGRRKNCSFEDLNKRDFFWTINSPLTTSVEQFVREAPNNVSASTILENLQDGNSGLPLGPILCNFGRASHLEISVKSVFEPVYFEANESSRRITIKWQKIDGVPRWISNEEIAYEVGQQDRRLRAAQQNYRDHLRAREPQSVKFAVGDDIEIRNLDGFTDFVADRQMYMNPADPVALFLKQLWHSEAPNRSRSIYAYLSLIALFRNYYVNSEDITAEWVEKLMSNNELESLHGDVDIKLFIEVARQRKSRIFDPFAWRRRDNDSL